MKRVSKHISYKEATRSYTATRMGIDNTPNEIILGRMRTVAEECFEPLREHHGKPIYISSFYRSRDLNYEIGGSPTSDHPNGYSIDIDMDVFNNGMTNIEAFEWLRENVDFDQLILENGGEWVHISFRTTETNRRQVLYT